MSLDIFRCLSMHFDAFRNDFNRGLAYNRMLEKDLPVVNLGSGREPVYFPADVCLVLPGQNYRSALDPRQMQQMMNFAVRKPGPNARSIVEQGLPTVGLRPANHAVSVGWRIDPLIHWSI